MEGWSCGSSLACAKGVGLAPECLTGGVDTAGVERGVEIALDVEVLEMVFLRMLEEAADFDLLLVCFLLFFLLTEDLEDDESDVESEEESLDEELPPSVALESADCLRPGLSPLSDESEDDDEDEEDEESL